MGGGPGWQGLLLGLADHPCPQAPRKVCGSPWTVLRRPSSPMTRWSSPSRAVRCESLLWAPPSRAGVGGGPHTPAECPPHSYVLTLITDGMRSVRAFHFDKAAASVLTSSVSRVSGGGPGAGPGRAGLASPLPVPPPDGHHGARVPVPRLSSRQLPAPQVHGEAAGAPGWHRPRDCRQGGRGPVGTWPLQVASRVLTPCPSHLTGRASLQEEACGCRCRLVRCGLVRCRLAG